MIVDYSGSSPQTVGPINCTYTGLVTGARCLFKAVTNPGIPANGGCFRPLRIICPPGTIISAPEPAPVSLYYAPLLAALDSFWRSEEHTSELQSLMRNSYAVFCLNTPIAASAQYLPL